MKKVLVVTSKLPWPATGADERDRAYGIGLLKEMGFEVRVIAKLAAYQKAEQTEDFSRTFDVPVTTVPYVKGGFRWGRLGNPLWLDGAAYEYTEPVIQRKVVEVCDSWKPNVVWLDCSFSWPLISLFKTRGLPVIVRPVTVESHNLLEEGLGGLNALKFLAKDAGEGKLARSADAVCAITPSEADFYKKKGAKRVYTLPLRQLPSVLAADSVSYRDTDALRIIFTGSTYNVHHNMHAAAFVIEQVAPVLLKALPAARIHVTGAKLPERLATKLPENVLYEGYVPDLDAFLGTMDIALPVYLGGAGMQGKIFEPITRGLPTVTMRKGLQGYSFVGNVDYLSITNAEEAVGAIMRLQSRSERERVGQSGRKRASEIFSKEKLQATIQEASTATT